MGICICICVTAIIITLIGAGCYYLENRSMQDQEAAMDLWSQLRDLRAKCNSMEQQIKELKEMVKKIWLTLRSFQSNLQ